MSHDTEPTPASHAARWVDAMIRAAYPETAGITLAAIEALAGQETYSPAQVAYLMSVMLDVGAQVRSAADRAELEASWRAGFEPQPTREARVALRARAMAEQAEIVWLRRTGEPRVDWPGGTVEQAVERFGWDADRPDGDFGPSAAKWHSAAGVPARRVAGRWQWREDPS